MDVKRVVKKTRKYLVPHRENNFRPYLLRAAGLSAVAFFILGSVFLTELQVLVTRGSSILAAVLPSVLVDLANTDRAQNNLQPLAFNPLLSAAAEAKAADMVAKGYFSHDSPDGVTPWHWFQAVGYNFAYAGENLAVNFDDSSMVNEAWMNSPAHRANLLSDKFTEVGVAIAEGTYKGRPATFVVEMFGTPGSPIVSGVESGAPTSVAVVSAAQPQKVEEKNLEPMPAPEVLGEKSPNITAVKNNAAEPLAISGDVHSAGTTPIVSPSAVVAGPAGILASSPSKRLGILYMFASFILAACFLSVLIVRHEARKRHVAFILAMFAVMFCAYYAYTYALFSGIVVV